MALGRLFVHVPILVAHEGLATVATKEHNLWLSVWGASV